MSKRLVSHSHMDTSARLSAHLHFSVKSLKSTDYSKVSLMEPGDIQETPNVLRPARCFNVQFSTSLIPLLRSYRRRRSPTSSGCSVWRLGSRSSPWALCFIKAPTSGMDGTSWTSLWSSVGESNSCVHVCLYVYACIGRVLASCIDSGGVLVKIMSLVHFIMQSFTSCSKCHHALELTLFTVHLSCLLSALHSLMEKHHFRVSVDCQIT